MMERQVNNMVRLVNELMEVSRITRGLIELREEETELATILRSAVETSRPFIDSGDHQLAVSIPQTPVPIYGDVMRLDQVFSNLLSNAAKYTDRGGQIWLSAREAGREVVISIRDTGVGIAAADLTRVFDLFAQADRSNGGSRGGLGIGLTLAKKIVEMHGGTIAAQSAGRGHGSEFTVRLPIAVQGRHPCEASPGTEARRDGSAQHRALVVDDNQDAATSLGILLQLLGVDVQTAPDGKTAIELIQSYHPDVVFVDLGMPGMDGFEVARRVRQRPEFEGMTLIALTGWGQSEDFKRTTEAGFDHHLVKPANLTALQSVLNADAREAS
jgi:CheY-like chemotaxis protein